MKDKTWEEQTMKMAEIIKKQEMYKSETTIIHISTYNRLLEKLEEFKTIKELKSLAEEMERIIKFELNIWN